MMSAASLTKCVIGQFKLVPIAQTTARSTTAAGNHLSASLNINQQQSRFKMLNMVSACAINTTQTAAGSSNTSSTSAPSETNEILLERHGDKGVITLNRPKALNAINYDMATKLRASLSAWDSDSQIRMVVMKSASERAFCAGGDVKRVCAEGPEEARKFFRLEYTVNNLIGSLSVPYVALIDGIIMGGGCGLSVHGNFRVVTEKALFAMPETAIGLFPDVGASHFLNKLPGSLGLYFGLTGQRLSGRDLFKAGIATHFIPSDKLKGLEDDLMRLEKPDLLKIDRVLVKHQEQWQDEYRKEFSLKPHIGRINSIFGQASRVEDIISGLEKDNSEWARKHLDLLAKMSPTSLKLTFEQLRRGKSMTLPECLKMEYRLVSRVLDKSEFYEGVRALLVDKDNKPKWNPANLADVKEEELHAFFEPLPHQEELRL